MKLTPSQWAVAKAWLNDIFVWGGLVSDSRRPTNFRYHTMYMLYTRFGATNRTVIDGKKAAEVVCEFIKIRPCDYASYANLDAALDTLSGIQFTKDLHDTTAWSSYGNVKKPKEMLARYIANFLAQNKFYIDNSRATTYEMDAIAKTISGAEMFDCKCFTSQDDAPVAKSAPSSGSARQPGQAPQNGYKSSGGQSANMKCLVGQPGVKLAASASVMFCIEADKTGKNTPNAYIKPLDSKHCPNGYATVYMGSGNGYTDCKCWFDDVSDAQQFLQKCQDKFGGTFTNIHISKGKPDSNGYFIAQTEFGNCGIKASKLNEEITEEVEPKAEAKEDFDIDVYTEAFLKYE